MFSDAKTLAKVMHRKIVFVKVESSIIEICESVHWSRCCNVIIFISVWNEILSGSQGTVNQMYPKKTSGARCRGTVVLESKWNILYSCFIAEISMGTLSGACN